MQDLGRLSKPQRLCLRQNQISHVSFPTGFGPHLQELDLYDNAISHIKNLGDTPPPDKTGPSDHETRNAEEADEESGEGPSANSQFPILTSLDLSFNKIKHIKRVNHLRTLTDLYFVQNKISKIEGLDGLSNLRNLELGANRIRVRLSPSPSRCAIETPRRSDCSRRLTRRRRGRRSRTSTV